MKICNILNDGKLENEYENVKQFVMDLVKFLGADHNTVMSAHRIGRKPTETSKAARVLRPRPRLVTFLTEEDRNGLYFARTSLKTSQQYKGIFINDDVTQQTHKVRDEFRSVAAMAYSAGKKT